MVEALNSNKQMKLIKAIKESQDKDSREVDKHSPETKETAQHFAGKNRQ